MKKKIFPGITLLGVYEPCHCGSYVLHSEDEAFILEMPPCRSKFRSPWKDAKIFLERNQLKLKGLLLSHAHRDHTASYPKFRRTFPNAPLYYHSSFGNEFGLGRSEVVFSSPLLELSLGDEKLIILHAPKHSHQDLLVIFRGCICSGDWSMGYAAECNDIVSTETKLRSLAFVKRYLRETNYIVHSSYSAHANEFYRGMDFEAKLEAMEAYCLDSLPKAA